MHDLAYSVIGYTRIEAVLERAWNAQGNGFKCTMKSRYLLAAIAHDYETSNTTLPETIALNRLVSDATYAYV